MKHQHPNNKDSQNQKFDNKETYVDAFHNQVWK